MSKARKKHEPHKQHVKPTHQAAHRERGTLLTIAIILVILNHILMLGLAYYDLTTNGIEAKSLYLPILLLTSMAGIIGGIAMWFWKSWGFQLYVVAAFVAATAALMNTGYLMVLAAGILPPIIVAYIYQPRRKYFD